MFSYIQGDSQAEKKHQNIFLLDIYCKLVADV